MVATVEDGKDNGDNYKLAYACVVYDLKKHRITSSNILSRFKKNDDGFALCNPQIDENYVYFVETSGSFERIDKDKVKDNRKRAVVVYTYSGKKIARLDYTKYIKHFKEYPNKDGTGTELSEEDCLLYVHKGRVYIATRKGIYVWKSIKSAPEKICGAKKTFLSNVSKKPYDIKYINKNRLALIYTYDDELNEQKYLNTVKF